MTDAHRCASSSTGARVYPWLNTTAVVLLTRSSSATTSAVAARAELRAAIIAGAPADERQALAAKVGEMETKLVMMRSNCTDHWRATLTEAQFAKMLELAAM